MSIEDGSKIREGTRVLVKGETCVVEVVYRMKTPDWVRLRNLLTGETFETNLATLQRVGWILPKQQ
jgi:hypothetical protein